MKRKTFDVIVATAGLFLALTLIVSGVLLTWAHNFVDNEVHNQLAEQQIYFPRQQHQTPGGTAVRSEKALGDESDTPEGDTSF
jgi:hypothetical protein